MIFSPYITTNLSQDKILTSNVKKSIILLENLLNKINHIFF